MSNSNGCPSARAELPEDLRERIDSLETPGLKAVLDYAEGRIESLRTPIEEEIEATAAGAVLQVDTHRAYALVRMRPPAAEDAGYSDVVSLYHVRRAHGLDGTSLQWTYLGDVHNSRQARCRACGRTRPADADVCPYCGGHETEHMED